MPDSAPSAVQTPAPPPLSRAVVIASLAASLMVGAFAISTQSYWIDEALSLIVSMAPNPAEAWKYAQVVSGSTLQMPLYQVYLFAWHKIFGGGEWAMRASNLPWFVLGQLAFLILLRHKPKLALTSCLLASVSPLLWMYLDETRPYIMQYAAACWLAAALVRFSSPLHSPLATRHPSLLLLALGAAAVILFGSSLLGVVWLGGFLAALAWLQFTRSPAHPSAPSPQTSSPAPPAWPRLPTAACVIILAAVTIALSAYYLWTWSMAGGGYHRSGRSLLSLPFIAYEFLGFSGFGPGKLQMRAEPVTSLIQGIPALLPLAVILAALGLFVLLQLRRHTLERRIVIAWILALGLPSLILTLGLFWSEHRVLPRHFIPALPALLLALAATINAAFAQKFILWRAIAILLPLLWLGSSLNFRWQPKYAKDDYRTAAAIAAAALAYNKEVWWAADAAAAYIYLTPVALEEVPGRAWAMQAPAWDDIRFKFPPRVIVISKPDIYDPQGSVARYASENQFAPALQLQAFTILTRHGQPLPTVTP